jgi:regulator of sirC expression with transglutaminase-like and TPR domain
MDASAAWMNCDQPTAEENAIEILLQGFSRIGRLHVLEKKLVSTYLDFKRFEEALHVQTKMIEHWTNKTTPYYDRASIYLKLGETAAARADLQAALLTIDQLPIRKSSTPAMKEMKSKIISTLNEMEN